MENICLLGSPKRRHDHPTFAQVVPAVNMKGHRPYVALLGPIFLILKWSSLDFLKLNTRNSPPIFHSYRKDNAQSRVHPFPVLDSTLPPYRQHSR